MRKSERDKRNYLIIGLCAVLVVMVVGFAAFSSQLQINGTSEITSNWDVRITKIEKIIPSGSSATDVSSECSESGTPKQCNDGLTATVSANLVSPGDSITYRIEVTNKGSLNAVLNRINLNDPSNNNVGYYINKDKSNQTIEDSGYRLLETNGVLNASGDSLDKGYVYLTIYYKDYEGQTSPTGGNKTVTATATFDFVQTNSEAILSLPSRNIDQTNVPQYFRYGTNYVNEHDVADTENWVQDSTELVGKNYFLGYDVEDGIITSTYGCFVISNTQYCLKGSYDGSTWSSNKTLLGTLRNSGIITCSNFDDEKATCSGDGIGYIGIGNGGDFTIGDSHNVSCWAFDKYGRSVCSE